MNAFSASRHMHNGRPLRSSTHTRQGISPGCFGGNFSSRSRPRGAGTAKPPSPAAAREPGRGSRKVGGRVERQHGTANTRRHLPIIPPTIPRIVIRCHGDPLFPGISSNEQAPAPRPSQNLWEASMKFLQQWRSYHVSFERTGFDTKQSALLGRSWKRLER